MGREYYGGIGGYVGWCVLGRVFDDKRTEGGKIKVVGVYDGRV